MSKAWIYVVGIVLICLCWWFVLEFLYLAYFTLAPALTGVAWHYCAQMFAFSVSAEILLGIGNGKINYTESYWPPLWLTYLFMYLWFMIADQS